ncbi:MAG: type IV secretory system conjugative DNA transfer family protein [Cyanobacteria bacterium P01_F01_bin.53]
MTQTYNAKQQQRALLAGHLIALGIGGGILCRNIPAYVLGAGLTTFGVVTAGRQGVRPDHALSTYSSVLMQCLTELCNPTTVESGTRQVVSAMAAQVPILNQLQESYTRLAEDPGFFNTLVTMDPNAKRFNPLVLGGLPGEGKTRVIQRLAERFIQLNPTGEVLVFDPEYDFNQSDTNGTPWPEHFKPGTHIFSDLSGLNAMRDRVKKRLATREAATPLMVIFDEFNNLRSFPGMPDDDTYYLEFLKDLKVAYNRAGKRGVLLVTGIQRIGAKETGLPLEYLASFPWLMFPKLARNKRIQTVLGLEENQKRQFLAVLAEMGEVVAMNNARLHPALYFTQESMTCKLIPHFEAHEVAKVIDPGLDWLLKVWQTCPHIIDAIENGEIKNRTELADPTLPWQTELASLLDENKLQRKNADQRWVALSTYWEKITSGEFRTAITETEDGIQETKTNP